MRYSGIVSHLPLFSVGMMLYAAIEALRMAHLQRTGLRVEGQVVDIDSTNEGDTPIVGFHAQDGKEYRFRVSVILGKERWAIGVTCPIVYPASHPERARVARFPQLWGIPLLFAAVGVLAYIGIRLTSWLFTIVPS